MLIKMAFRKTLAGIAVAAALAAAAMTGCATSASSPATPAPTLEATVQATATPLKPEEKYGTLSWKEDYRSLSYTLNGVSVWKVDSVADGIEEEVLNLSGGRVFKTPKDFLIDGALVDEKYGRAIVWGKVQNASLSKISVRSLHNGMEVDSYWLDGDIVNSVQVAYNAVTEQGIKDVMIIGGYMEDTDAHHSLFVSMANKLGYSINQIPFIAVRDLPSGESLGLHPLALVEGEITGSSLSQDASGKVNLALSTVTYDDRRKRNEGLTNVSLDKVLAADYGAPVIGQ